MKDLDGPAIVYDGDCPFCTAYTKMIRLRDALGEVRLIDAREGGQIPIDLQSNGYNLDDGFVFILDGEIFHGPDALHRLALLTTRFGWFNRFTSEIFKRRAAARFFYPGLVIGRNITLRLLGRGGTSISSLE